MDKRTRFTREPLLRELVVDFVLFDRLFIMTECVTVPAYIV